MRAALVALSFIVAACGATHNERPAPAASARNLVIITIDTLRADRVGAYGYTHARTPTLDALAAEGVRFTQAYATAPITLTSHASLMTGRYPPGHGARPNPVPPPRPPDARALPPRPRPPPQRHADRSEDADAGRQADSGRLC